MDRCNEHEWGKLQEMVRVREAWVKVVHGVAKFDMTGRLNNNDFDIEFLIDSFDYLDFDYIISLTESIHCFS